MEKLILAVYSGLSVTSLMSCLIGAIVLERFIRQRNFSSTFWITLSLVLTWTGEFMMRMWWSVWKSRKLAGEPNTWMVNHPMVILSCLVMISGGVILIKTLTEEMGEIKILIFTLFVIIYVAVLVYVL